MYKIDNDSYGKVKLHEYLLCLQLCLHKLNIYCISRTKKMENELRRRIPMGVGGLNNLKSCGDSESHSFTGRGEEELVLRVALTLAWPPGEPRREK